MKKTFKVGLFGCGLETYWNQFVGLQKFLTEYQESVCNRMSSRSKIEVINAGIVDNPFKAADAVSLFQKEEVELVFIFITTYCLSSTILPIAQRVDCPLIILNLQPQAAIDYEYINNLEDRGKMTGYWLQYCQACSVPEISNVFNRSNICFELVTGYFDDEIAWDEIDDWILAAKVKYAMKNNRLGILGHYYNGMLDVYTDLTQQSAIFGTHIEFVEMCEVKKYRDEITESDIDSKIKEFESAFDVSKECELDELRRAAKTSVAMDKLVENRNLGSLAYYYEGENGNDYEDIVTSLIAGNTLLTGKNMPVAGECEVKTVQAMKILSEFGAGGSFSEFYAMDFNDDVVLLGHDGPAHFDIAEGRVGLVPVPIYHGKPGKGLSIQMTVKYGKVTLLSVCENKIGIFLLIAEGESVEGATLSIGNTNSRYRFSCGAREFMNSWSKMGPSHHTAVGIGHIASKIEKLANLLNIPFIRVC